MPAPSSALFYGTYDLLKTNTLRRRSASDADEEPMLTAAESLLFGGMAGMGSEACCFPLEVLRRRTQESARLSFSSTFGMRQCGLGLVASRNQPVISEKLRFRLEIVEAMRVRTHRSGKAIRAHVLQHIGEDIRVAVEE